MLQSCRIYDSEQICVLIVRSCGSLIDICQSIYGGSPIDITSISIVELNKIDRCMKEVKPRNIPQLCSLTQHNKSIATEDWQMAKNLRAWQYRSGVVDFIVPPRTIHPCHMLQELQKISFESKGQGTKVTTVPEKRVPNHITAS